MLNKGEGGGKGKIGEEEEEGRYGDFGEEEMRHRKIGLQFPLLR